jgi:NAD(P)H-dependent FMN reductase
MSLAVLGIAGSLGELKQSIRDSDALPIAAPEYNYGIPGVLKNAIDWASRPPAGSVLLGKRTAIMGGSVGSGATLRSQMQLHQQRGEREASPWDPALSGMGRSVTPTSSLGERSSTASRDRVGSRR